MCALVPDLSDCIEAAQPSWGLSNLNLNLNPNQAQNKNSERHHDPAIAH